jgi:hypothetical protein
MAEEELDYEHEVLNKLVEITEDNVTLAGAVWHHGQRFPASQVSEAIYGYVKAGQIFGAQLIDGDGSYQSMRVQHPDITIGWQEGRPMQIPVDGRPLRGAHEEVNMRDSPVTTYAAPTVADEAAARRMGLAAGVAGAAALELRLQAQAATRGQTIMPGDGSPELANHAGVGPLQAQVDDDAGLRAMFEDQGEAQQRRSVALNRQRYMSAGIDPDKLEPTPVMDEDDALPPKSTDSSAATGGTRRARNSTGSTANTSAKEEKLGGGIGSQE